MKVLRLFQVVIKISWVLVLLCTGGKIFCQISDNSTPASFEIKITTKNLREIPFSVLDSVNVEERIAEDKNNGIPNRFGVVQGIEIDIREKGLKTEQGNVIIWRYKISCPDALSLGLVFGSYHLPPGARAYIYSTDKTLVRGAFTSNNNKKNKKLALAVFNNSELIIEYNEPKNAIFEGKVIIGSVAKAYQNFPIPGNDYIDINCDEGTDWQIQKRSVCRMLFQEGGDWYYCSGALVNNVREDKTPYFLTANHCISSGAAASTLITYFNYENSTCYSSDASDNQTLSGSILKATSEHTDFSLLELSEYPPDEYTPYFAGWNASDDEPTSGTCIHHPEGIPKCIAIDNDAPNIYPYQIEWSDGDNSVSNTTSPNTHWSVNYDAGSDASGSSGSPLFDTDKRIIGQLHGGSDFVSFFGLFSLSWDYNSSITEQLKHWLDPDNTGTLRLDGLNYDAFPEADFDIDVISACLNTPVFLTDKSSNNPTSWLWKIEPGTYEFINSTNQNSQNPEVVFTSDDTYSITLVVSNKYGYDSARYENLVSASSELAVGFYDLSGSTSLCGSEFDNFKIIATGAKEYDFSVSASDYFDIGTNEDTLFLTLNNEGQNGSSFDTYIKVTGNHGNCYASDSVLFHVIIPQNDNIQNAIALKLGQNKYYSNECGTVEDNEPYPSTSGCYTENNWCPPVSNPVLENSIWFTFKGTSNKSITIETESFDTQIAVYEADSYEDILSGNSTQYTILAANDDPSSSETAAKIEGLKVETGKTYWLQVDGNDGDYGDLGINLLSNTIEVYPNPSGGVFHLTIGSMEAGDADLNVFTTTGNNIYSKTVNLGLENNTIDLDLSTIPPGVYFFRADINGVTMTKKLVLSKNK